MLALPLLLLVVSQAPDIQRERKSERAARLMTAEERAKLADIERQLEELRRPSDNTTVLVTGSVTLGLGAVYPVVVGAVAGVLTIFVGFVGLFTALLGSPSILNWVGSMWGTLFGWIPVWGWIAFAAVTAIGLGVVVGAQLADRPRQLRVDALKYERKRMVNEASKRSTPPMLEVPMTTVMVF